MGGEISRITGQESVPGFRDRPKVEKLQDGSLPDDTIEAKAPRKSGEKREPREYTILAYESAANDLEDFMVNDVKEMENCPPSDNYSLVVQLARYRTSALTREFLAAALCQVFATPEFRESLRETVSDRQLIEQYGELLKDTTLANNMALILLQRNPVLQDRLDKLVQSKVSDVVQDNRNVSGVLDEATQDVLSEIEAREKARQEEELVQSFARSLPQSMAGAASEEKGLFADIARTAGDFIRGVEGLPGSGDAKVSGAGANLAKLLGGRRESVLFVDSGRSGKSRRHHGDIGKALDSADQVEINREPRWRGVRRYEIVHDDDPTRINARPLAKLGHKEMSRVETLVDFITWGMENYPARRYIVLLSNHGAGFLGAEEDKGNMLSLPDIREAFETVKKNTGKTPDILAFDCCFMGQAEVAYELKDSARYMVASEEVIGGGGFPYGELLPAIDRAIAGGKTDPKDIASIFVDEGKKVNEAATFTLSAIHLAAMDCVGKGVDRLAGHILEGKADLEEVKSTLKVTQRFNVGMDPSDPYDDFRDLGDFVDKLNANPRITDPAVKKDLGDLKEALARAVIKEQHQDDEDYEGAKGLSIYAPRRKRNITLALMEEYEKTLMGRGTNWAALIKRLTDFDELAEGNADEAAQKKPRLTFINLPSRPL